MSFKQSKIAEGVPPPLQRTPVGSVQGKFGKGSIEYLGIRYASLEHRLVKPKVIEYARPETLDATKHGYGIIVQLLSPSVLQNTELIGLLIAHRSLRRPALSNWSRASFNSLFRTLVFLLCLTRKV